MKSGQTICPAYIIMVSKQNLRTVNLLSKQPSEFPEELEVL